MEQAPDIVMTAAQWHILRSHLLRPPGAALTSADEQLAFMLASGNASPARQRLLVRELLLAGPADLLDQSPVRIVPRPEFVMRAMNRCLSEGWHLIEIHSHPFDRSTETTFSGIDWESDRGKMPGWAALVKHMVHVTMVMGHNALDAHFYNRATRAIEPIKQVVVVGVTPDRPGLRVIPTTYARRNVQNEVNLDAKRYHRQELIFGREVQGRLREATVAIVGLGGLGSFVALELAHLGVGHLILVDPDHVEHTNLNRLIGTNAADVGSSKVEVYAQLVKQLDPTIQVEALPGSIVEEAVREQVKCADVLMGCVDSHGARLVLNQMAARYLIPLIDGGSGVGRVMATAPLSAGGQAQVILPGTGCLECRGFIDPRRAAFDLASPQRQQEERLHGYGTEEAAPAVIFLNGVIGSLEVAELVFLLAGSDLKMAKMVPPTSLYDAFERAVRPVNPQSSLDCPTCGEDGVLGLGDLAPLPFVTEDSTREQVIPDNASVVETGDQEQMPETSEEVKAQSEVLSTLEYHSEVPTRRHYLLALLRKFRRKTS